MIQSSHHMNSWEYTLSSWIWSKKEFETSCVKKIFYTVAGDTRMDSWMIHLTYVSTWSHGYNVSTVCSIDYKFPCATHHSEQWSSFTVISLIYMTTWIMNLSYESVQYNHAIRIRHHQDIWRVCRWDLHNIVYNDHTASACTYPSRDPSRTYNDNYHGERTG